MPIFVLFAPVARAVCVDVPLELGAAERAIVDARLDDASRSLERVEVEIAAPPGSGNGTCARLDPATVARFWIAEGAAASLGGSAEAASRAFRAAARVVPEQWTVAFGPALRAEWAWAAQMPDARGTIALDQEIVGWTTWLDGTESAFPIETADGLHLVQIGTGDVAAWGAIVLVPAEETFVVRVPALPPLPLAADPIETTEVTPPRDRSRVRKTAFVAGGAACLIAGGAVAWMAEQKDDDVAGAADVDELSSAHRSQQALGALSYGLLGVGATGVVVGLVW